MNPVHPKTRSGLIFLAMLGLFGLSIYIRMPYMERPLGRIEEWSTANDLRYIQIWYEEGGLKNKFALNSNYPNPADKHIINNINNDPSTIYHDKFGNYYYVSFPPFSLMFPYFIFKIFRITPDIMPLKWIGVFLQFVAAFFLYRIVGVVCKHSGLRYHRLAGLLAFLIYTFSSGPLFWWANVYIPEIAVQSLFAISLYLFLRIIWSDRPKRRHYALFGIAHFFMGYAEWLGLFFGAVIILYCLLHLKEMRYRVLFWLTLITSIAPVALTLWQYAEVNSFEALIKAMVARYRQRGGGLLTGSRWQALHWPLWQIVLNYHIASYGYFLGVMAALAAGVLSMRNFKFRILTPAFYGAFAPAILYNIIFFNVVHLHAFYVLESGLGIGMLAGLLSAIFLTGMTARISSRTFKGALCVCLALLFATATLLSVSRYKSDFEYTNPSFKLIGQYIGGLTPRRAMIFLGAGRTKFMGELYQVAPEVVWYAHRNIATWTNEADALALMKLNGVRRAAVFELDTTNLQGGSIGLRRVIRNDT